MWQKTDEVPTEEKPAGLVVALYTEIRQRDIEATPEHENNKAVVGWQRLPSRIAGMHPKLVVTAAYATQKFSLRDRMRARNPGIPSARRRGIFSQGLRPGDGEGV